MHRNSEVNFAKSLKRLEVNFSPPKFQKSQKNISLFETIWYQSDKVVLLLYQVTSIHLIKAEKLFGSLSFAATSNLSQFKLVSLLEQAKQLTTTKETSKKKQSKMFI